MKIKSQNKQKVQLRHGPLADDIEGIEKPRAPAATQKNKPSKHKKNVIFNKKEGDQILKGARQQRHELGLASDSDHEDWEHGAIDGEVVGKGLSYFKPSADYGQRLQGLSVHSDTEHDADFEAASRQETDSLAAGNNTDQIAQMSKEEEDLFNSFMSSSTPEQLNLASAIVQKLEISLGENLAETVPDRETLEHKLTLDPRIVNTYKKIGEIMANYRSGALPKALKLIPTLRDWEEVLYLTNPDEYTPAALYQLTKLIVMGGTIPMAQKFMNLVVLPRVRDEIAQFKRLNPHIHSALSKSLYKPATFFKGLLLPLLSSGTCTLREAVILGSVISKNSTPVLHASAVMLKLAALEYNGATSLILRIFLDKKYALPYTVIDALAQHFLNTGDPKKYVKRREADGFANARFTKELPLLWHHCLLSFATRYKEDLTLEQKNSLLDVIKINKNPTLYTEIKRELLVPKSRPDLLSSTSDMAEDGMAS